MDPTLAGPVAAAAHSLESFILVLNYQTSYTNFLALLADAAFAAETAVAEAVDVGVTLVPAAAAVVLVAGNVVEMGMAAKETVAVAAAAATVLQH